MREAESQKSESFKNIKPLQGHSKSVGCFVVLENGNFISGSDDGTLKKWDTKTGECLKTIKAHSGAVRCIAVLQNGNFISGSDDGTLKEWDKNTGECAKVLQEVGEGILCAVVHPNGKLITGPHNEKHEGDCFYNALKVWDTKTGTGKCLMVLQGHTDSVLCVDVLQNGNIISGSHDETLKEWDITTTGKCLKTFNGHSGSVLCVTALQNNNFISGSYDGTLKEWDNKTDECVITLTGHTDSVTCIAVLQNGNFTSGCDDGTLKEWDKNTGECLNTIQQDNNFRCIAVLPNGNIVSGSDDNSLIQQWETRFLKHPLAEMNKSSSFLYLAPRLNSNFFPLPQNESNKKIIEDAHNKETPKNAVSAESSKTTIILAQELISCLEKDPVLWEKLINSSEFCKDILEIVNDEIQKRSPRSTTVITV